MDLPVYHQEANLYLLPLCYAMPEMSKNSPRNAAQRVIELPACNYVKTLSTVLGAFWTWVAQEEAHLQSPSLHSWNDFLRIGWYSYYFEVEHYHLYVTYRSTGTRL